MSDDNIYVKDLRIFNREMKHIILVDNAAYSFIHQVDNGIPIIPFYDNKEDDQLLKLKEYLIEINKHDDIRTVNKRHFRMYKYFDHTSPDSLVKVLFPNLNAGLNLSLD